MGTLTVSCDCCIFAPLLGETLRPGGLALTARVAELASLDQSSRVLEIACGKGTTALSLAQKYNCSVVGIELSDRMIASCQGKAEIESPAEKVSFVLSDGGNLPFCDSTFDAVICECSFSLLPDMKGSAREIMRVLRSGGRLVISDVILRGKPTREMGNPLSFTRCFASAKPVEEYLGLLEQVGFVNLFTEDHSQELRKIAFQIGMTFGGIKGLIRKPQTELHDPEPEEKQVELPSDTYLTVFKEARPGYAIIAATRP